MDLLRSTRSRLAAAGLAAAAVAPLVLVSPAFAGTENPTPVSGVASCNTATGLHEITWTVDNNTNYVVDIDSSVLSGNATGSPVFSPNPVQPDESATSEGTLPGDISGPVVLTVETSWLEVEFPMDATSSFTLNLTACVQVTTTTTSAPTTTTTTPPAVPPVVVSPRFTG
jgi:hypothetical protein